MLGAALRDVIWGAGEAGRRGLPREECSGVTTLGWDVGRNHLDLE